ncbi:efflux RND transporter periplasmic adaptor subunit [Sporosarcina gallistercoris]|uniref:Efflux RND transporter periplasmic adaptor subunit n=1 Tax=Sporosarcina gallistercoris TaxID=2762245 RepID=A0ABR8PLV9_9BACL|nr:efflux RND transporter periplasmic adaptor subunit [Sporosarcina gallistercoris]MBD7909142.1 efflux RND transporter periplasmic adaptor subunit [Sporosarcina gallistercoris]
MNKFTNAAIGVVVSIFVALNLYLMYSEKSVIPKSVYVGEYERMSAKEYKEVLPKEGLVAPAETFTVYTSDSNAIDTWLVREGDAVTTGEELATLQTEQADGQRAVWESEKEALLTQQSTIRSTISDLESGDKTDSSNSSKSDRTQTDDDTKVELNVDVKVDVNQTGSFAQAIAEAERDLADTERRLKVVESQLDQNSSNPALISPTDGVVARIIGESDQPKIVIYSNEQVVETYAEDEEWSKLANGDPAVLDAKGTEGTLKGSVESIDQVPATPNEFLEAYKTLADKKVTNPLAYYRVRLSADEGEVPAPFGTHVNTVITTNVAQNAAAVRTNWLTNAGKDKASVWQLDKNGYAAAIEVATPFEYLNRTVVTEGLASGDVVVHDTSIRDQESAPRVFFPMPMDLPTKAEWKAFGWKNYFKVLLLKQP